jgi:hypothetical protein
MYIPAEEYNDDSLDVINYLNQTTAPFSFLNVILSHIGSAPTSWFAGRSREQSKNFQATTFTAQDQIPLRRKTITRNNTYGFWIIFSTTATLFRL